jgi:poly(3-hydroxybutyrate) depolymerase
MNGRAVFVGIALILGTTTEVFASSGDLKKEILDVAGRRHQYFVFAPGGIGDTPVPMLVLLHGSGRDGRSLINPWKKIAERERLILVAPNAIDPAGWQNPVDGPEALIAIAEDVVTRHSVDKTRVYLFGHSAGAVFGLLMPIWEPRYFAAVSVHAGAIPRGSEGLAQDAARAVKRKTPIQIQVGTSDRFFPLDDVRATRNLLTASGFFIDLREIAGHDHNYYSMSERINEDAWRFFATQRMRAK